MTCAIIHKQAKFQRVDNVKCLYSFLSERYQHNLRRLAQLQEETYENALKRYARLFKYQFSQCVFNCCESNVCDCKYGEALSSCADIKEFLKPIIEEIDVFFKALIDIYLCWINAKPEVSLKRFRNLIAPLLVDDNNLDYYDTSIMFRGRVSNSQLTKNDMFHIPFNKRYLVGNQRFSLTGQPMIYLSSSVFGVANELGFDFDEFDSLKVSSYMFIDTFRIFDLRNQVISKFWGDIPLSPNIDLGLIKKEITADYARNYIMKLILSSSCSFERKNEIKTSSFCEEYVLPQVLALSLKRHKYDGIVYYSSKRVFSSEINNDGWSYSIEEENTILASAKNIALFTELKRNNKYDNNLYKRIEFNAPSYFYDINSVNVSDIEEIISEITSTRDQEKILLAENLWNRSKIEFEKLFCCGSPYFEHWTGRIHLFKLYAVLNNILIM